MNKIDLTELVFSSIENDHINDALQLLKDEAKKYQLNNLSEDIAILISRKKSNETSQIKGIIGHEQYILEYNKIKDSIFLLLAKIKNHSLEVDFSPSQPIELGEKRTELIGRFARFVHQNYSGSIIRQIGGFSSFSIPFREVGEKVWIDRKGNTNRSLRYHQFQLEERKWLGKIAKEKYAKLIVNPNLHLAERGDKATLIRINALLEFIKANRDCIDIITSDGFKRENLLIVGNHFMSESKEGDSKDGYKNTFFSGEPEKVNKKISYFDSIFADLLYKNQLDIYSAKEKAIYDLEKAAQKYAKSSQSVHIENPFISENNTFSHELNDFIRYIKYDSVIISLDDDQYANLGRKFIHLKKEDNTPEKLEKAKNLVPAIPYDPKVDTGNCRAFLSNYQYNRLINYLASGDYYRESFGSINEGDFIIAFAYGESADVNKALAMRALEIAEKSTVNLIAQWEIDDFILNQEGFNRKIRIDKNASNYLSSEDIVAQVKEIIDGKTQRVGIIANSWHAPRCIEICQKQGLNVEFGLFVDMFSENDPQPWVRDVLSWVIKESQK